MRFRWRSVAVTADDLAGAGENARLALDVFTVYGRCKRIVRSLPETSATCAGHYTEPATAGLYEASESANQRMAANPTQRTAGVAG